MTKRSTAKPACTANIAGARMLGHAHLGEGQQAQHGRHGRPKALVRGTDRGLAPPPPRLLALVIAAVVAAAAALLSRLGILRWLSVLHSKARCSAALLWLS